MRSVPDAFGDSNLNLLGTEGKHFTQHFASCAPMYVPHVGVQPAASSMAEDYGGDAGDSSGKRVRRLRRRHRLAKDVSDERLERRCRKLKRCEIVDQPARHFSQASS